MATMTLEHLLEAVSPGGASCLTSLTELEPAAGESASVAPAKFAVADKRDVHSKRGVFAYERRFLDGRPQEAVIIDSKQSQLNRAEAALEQAVEDGHPVLARLPRVEVQYERGGVVERYWDLTLPHRVFDGHIRAATVDGTPITQLDAYRAIRNASPANARALLDASPVSLVFGSWDSSRATRQGRWRSALVGEIIGFCADSTLTLRGGARVDPVGMQIQLAAGDIKAFADVQRDELSVKTYKEAIGAAAKSKGDERKPMSQFGLGGIPPTLDALAGVACHRIIRSHVLSFATLRQIRFGAGPQGDAACRALLAALALNGLARSDSELYLRANCDLREKGPSRVEVDERGGGRIALEALDIGQADALLAAALSNAEQQAGVTWNGVWLTAQGNPAIVAGALAGDDDGAS